MVQHTVIILAAGEGTRMRSSLPKVLHPVAGWPMLRHVVHAASGLGGARVSLVIGAGAEQVQKSVAGFAPDAQFFMQNERLGTAHAVLCARAALQGAQGVVIVLFGDTPLMQGETLARLSSAVQNGAAVAVLGFEAYNPFGYGRVVMDAQGVAVIVEEKDASDEQRHIRLCNAGAMAMDASIALELLENIGNENAKGEYYLTDIVKIARTKGLKVECVIGAEEEALGANTRVELAQLEHLFQRRKRYEMMMSGVSLIAPETVFFAADTEIAADVVIEPNVVFGLGVKIASQVVVHAFSHIEGAMIDQGASVGPYARLRPGTVLEEGARVGNFVEVKNTRMAMGAKANHLTYLGDSTVGQGANIGAGTITCNYDGFNKSRTEIGAGAFIGSNSALVAPVVVGDGAIVAAGSVITGDVPTDALAVARGRQVNHDGLAQKFREKRGKG